MCPGLFGYPTFYAPDVESNAATAYEASAIGSKEVAVEVSERVYRDALRLREKSTKYCLGQHEIFIEYMIPCITA